MSLNMRNADEDDHDRSLHVFGRRTRSGTVIGPPSNLPRTILEKISLLDAESDDELILQHGKEDILDDNWIICKMEGQDAGGSAEAGVDELNIGDQEV
jgi:hypothetical protein